MRLPALVGAFAGSATLLLPLGLSVLRAAGRGRFDVEEARPAMPLAMPSTPQTTTTTRPRPSTRPSTTRAERKWPLLPRPLFPVLKAFDGSVISRRDYRRDFGQISRKNKAIFVHVPKTGGSTIEDSGLFEDAQPFHNTKGHSDAEMLRGLAPGFRSFTMVRHPCERFVSAWTYIHTTDAPQPERKWYRKHMGHGNLTTYVASKFFGSPLALHQTA